MDRDSLTPKNVEKAIDDVKKLILEKVKVELCSGETKNEVLVFKATSNAFSRKYHMTIRNMSEEEKVKVYSDVMFCYHDPSEVSIVIQAETAHNTNQKIDILYRITITDIEQDAEDFINLFNELKEINQRNQLPGGDRR